MPVMMWCGPHSRVVCSSGPPQKPSGPPRIACAISMAAVSPNIRVSGMIGQSVWMARRVMVVVMSLALLGRAVGLRVALGGDVLPAFDAGCGVVLGPVHLCSV